MSYNLLSGSVEFIGDKLGEVEDIVNTHTSQTITGAKLFSNITASHSGTDDEDPALFVIGFTRHTNGFSSFELGDVASSEPGGEMGLRQTTNGSVISFSRTNSGDDSKYIFLKPAGAETVKLFPTLTTFNGTEGQDCDFLVEGTDNGVGLKFDSNRRSVIMGNTSAASFDGSDVLLSISSSYHTGSLLSVGSGKNPIFAVSGSDDYDTRSPRVLITGSLLVGGRHGSVQETRFTGGNIIAEGVVTGSAGLRGELLNTYFGLEHVVNGGEKKLTVKAHTGIDVGGNGVAVDVHGLTDVGSVNTSTSNQDYICVADYSNGNATAKMGVGDLLSNTLGTVANVGTGTGQVYKTTTSREVKLKSINAGSGITVTNNTDDVTIAASAPPVATYDSAGAGRLVVSVDSTTIEGEDELNWTGTTLQVTGALEASAEITAAAFIGDGSGLTNIGAGGANGQVQINISGTLNGNGSFTAKQENTPADYTELYLTGALHAHHVEVATSLVVDTQTTLYNAGATHLTASNALFSGGQRIATSVKTTNYTLDSQVDRLVIFNTSNNVTATLPTITTETVGSIYTVKNVNIGEVHVTGTAPGGGGAIQQLLDGAEYLVLSGSIAGDGPYVTLVGASFGGGSFDYVVIDRHLSPDPS